MPILIHDIHIRYFSLIAPNPFRRSISALNVPLCMQVCHAHVEPTWNKRRTSKFHEPQAASAQTRQRHSSKEEGQKPQSAWMIFVYDPLEFASHRRNIYLIRRASVGRSNQITQK